MARSYSCRGRPTRPPGLVYQVYENDVLVWHGSSPYCTLPLPSYTVRFDIGTVGFTQQNVELRLALAARSPVQADLTWNRGDVRGADIAGFHVYGENSPGAGIDFTSIVAIVPAYTAGVITDGFGYGGFGDGGFGEAAGSYSWTSGALTSGVWQFAVVPFDTAGNEGTGSTVADFDLGTSPGAGAVHGSESRPNIPGTTLNYVITLNWNPFPWTILPPWAQGPVRRAPARASRSSPAPRRSLLPPLDFDDDPVEPAAA